MSDMDVEYNEPINESNGYVVDSENDRPITSTQRNFEEEIEYQLNNQANVAEKKDNRPLDIRLEDKNWKTRLTAYEDLKALVVNSSSDQNIYERYGSMLTKLTSDSNAGALDVGVDCSIAFIDNCPETYLSTFLSTYSDKIYSNIVDKAFSGKPSTLNKGKALLMKMMEVDDPTSCTQFLLTKLMDKKPKIPPTCLEIIRDGVIAFGAKPFPIKEIISQLGQVLNGTNSQARENAVSLLIEIVRWIGSTPFANLIDSLRPAQKSDIEKLISEIEKAKPVPTVYLRKLRPTESQLAALKSADAVVVDNSIDTRAFIDEIDLVKKLKGLNELVVCLNEEKWSEQLRGLTMIIDAMGPTPKLKINSQLTDYLVNDLIPILKAFMRPGHHIQVELTTLRLLSLLSDGMRTDFNQIVRPLLSTILNKVKEKKLVTEVEKTITSIMLFCYTQVDVIFDESVEILNNKKNPSHAKIGVLNIFQSLFPSVNQTINFYSMDNYKQLIDVSIGLSDDSDSKIRELTTSVLSKIFSIVKIKGKLGNECVKMINAIENTNTKLYKKIITYGNDNGNGKEPNKLNSTVSTTETPAVTKLATVSKPVGTRRPATTSTNSTKTNNSAANPKKASTAASNANADLEEISEELSYSYEDALVNLVDLGIPEWQDGFQALMNSSKWQEKVDSLTTMSKCLIDTQLGRKLSGYLVVYLSKISNGFKITNVNVLKAVIQVCCDAADCKDGQNANDKFNKAAGWELIKQFGDKLTDKKLSDVIATLLVNLSKSISISFVVSRMKSVLEKTKSPAAHQIYLEWLKARLIEQGANNYPLAFLSTFCQVEIENKVASVRTAAIEVLGEIFHQIGPRSQSIIISDAMKPQIKQLLENEFNRVGFDPTILTSKSTVDSDKSKSSGMSLIPRVDLTNQLDKNIITELNLVEGKNSWINRKNALESIINQINQSGYYIDYNKNLLELIKSIKLRLLDTQANLKPIAVSALGFIVLSLDTESAIKVIKLITTPLLNCLTDNKKQLRDSVLHVLDMILYQNKDKVSGDNLVPLNRDVAVAYMSAILPFTGEVLLNPIGRTDFLPYLITNQQFIQTDANFLLTSLFTCLQDKIASTRLACENLTIYLITNGYLDKITLEKGINNLTVQQKRFLQTFIDKILLLFQKKVEKKVETKFDSKVDSKVDIKLDTKLDNKAEIKLENRISPIKKDSKITVKANSKAISQLVSQVDKQLSTQLGNKVDIKADAIIDNHEEISTVDSRIDSRVNFKVDKEIENKIDNEIVKEIDLYIDKQVNSKVYKEVDSEIDIEIDNKIDMEVSDYLSSNPFVGIFADITNKLDTWLTHSTTDISGYLSCYVVSCDYLKILHEIAIDRWIVDGVSDSRELIRSLGENVEHITNRLCDYIFHCFTINQLISESNNQTIQKIDKELDILTNGLSVCLSTLFQLLAIKDVPINLSNQAVENILSTMLICLSDNRLTADLTNIALSNDSKQFISNVVKALNMIALRVCSSINNDLTLINLLHILLKCALTQQITKPIDKSIYLSNKLGSEVVPTTVSVPASRLVLHILSNEVSNQHPFDSNTFNIKIVLKEIHEFYLKHPLNQLENDQPFRCSKTIMNEIVKSLGANQVMDFLQELAIPLTSYVYKITAKLGNIAIPSLSPDLNLSIVSMIDEITSSSNKYDSIYQLYLIMKKNPGIDISIYLSGVSVAFRRYILDTLEAIRSSNATNNENIRQQTNQLTSKKVEFEKPSTSHSPVYLSSHPTSNTSNTNLSGYSSNYGTNSNYVSNNADEAMRILDGLRQNKPLERSSNLATPLKSRSDNNLLGTPSGIPTLHRNTTPRAAIQDRVRGSLNTLSMQLDLPSTKISRETVKSFTIDESLQFDDEELNNRINKLKNFNR